MGFREKLARLPPMSIVAGSFAAPAPPAVLDDLRERIARIIARAPPRPPRADPSASELPFVVQRTASGPLYLRRARAAFGSRVGRAPLVAARDADPAILALLALDPAIASCAPR